MERKKINWLLILQGWAMLWVVIGHAPLGDPESGPLWVTMLYRFAYSFHMPLFMMVSGYLFYSTRISNELEKEWPYHRIIRDKSVRLLLPGFIFSLVALATKVAFPSEMSRQTGISTNELVHGFVYPYDNPLRELWFIVTLFWFFLLAPLWRFTLSNLWTICMSSLFFVVLYFWHPNTEFLCIGRVFRYGIWFYLGLAASRIDAVEKLIEKPLWIVPLVGVLLYVVGMMINSIITTMGGIAFSFGLALILDRFLSRAFFSFRNYTYQIFLMGIFAQFVVKIVYRHVELPYLPTYLLCVAFGLYVPVLVSKLLEWKNWKPLLLCVGLK